MSLFQGWADAPSTGAYDEQEVSDVFKQSIAQTIWLPFATKKKIESGYTFTVPILSDLDEPTSSELNEETSIPLDKLTITAKTISLTERGRGVQVTKKNMQRSPIELLNAHRTRLAEQMSLDMDTVLGAAFQSGQLKYAATGASSYGLATAGSFTSAALSNANFYHIRKMRDLAFRTYFMPKLGTGKYAFVCSTASYRGILDDPEFLEINAPQNSSIFQGNSAGTLAGVDIYEDNHALADNVGTNSDVGEGVFISRDAVYFGVLDEPSIRFDASENSVATDFGRFISLAWRGDWGAGTSTDSGSAGFARLFHFGSS